jgi:hypothetical protein
VRSVVRCQQRLGEPGGRMLAEVGRDVADAQPSSGRSIDDNPWAVRV